MADDSEIIPLADEPSPGRRPTVAPRQAGQVLSGQVASGRVPTGDGSVPKAPGRGGQPVRASGACAACGYSLTGLTLAATRCPECGAILPRIRADRRSAEAAELARQAWREPVWYLVPALPVVAVLAAAVGGWELAIAYIIGFVIMLPVLLGSYLLCCWMWLGFDAPWPLILLRLAAVQAVSDVGFFAGSFTGVTILALALGGLVYVGMMVKLMEIDAGDAILVGLVGMLLTGGAGFALLSLVA